MTTTITRRIEFDAGHRVPDHASKCWNMHGHRYVLEATLRGPVVETPGPTRGMIMDFADLKDVLIRAVGEPWDHAFLVWKEDIEMLEAFKAFDMAVADGLFGPGRERRRHKTFALPAVPTVENLVLLARDRIWAAKPALRPLLSRVVMWETPNCSATWEDQ